MDKIKTFFKDYFKYIFTRENLNLFIAFNISALIINSLISLEVEHLEFIILFYYSLLGLLIFLIPTSIVTFIISKKRTSTIKKLIIGSLMVPFSGMVIYLTIQSDIITVYLLVIGGYLLMLGYPTLLITSILIPQKYYSQKAELIFHSAITPIFGIIFALICLLIKGPGDLFYD